MSVLTALAHTRVESSCVPTRPVVIGESRQGGVGAGFRDYRMHKADMKILARDAGKHAATLAELFPVAACLNRHPAVVFANLSDLYASLGAAADGKPSAGAIGIVRDLFLETVNRRLQRVYRAYFRDHPPPPEARHDWKIASLEATRGEAQAIVDDYDWPWLAEWLELGRIGENAESCVRRLSNFAFHVQCLNFRFTFHCNIACRHCYNSSGPQLKAQRIALEPMLAIVAQMPGAGIGRLNLSGGEPFLYPDDLAALIAAGRKAGLPSISINTNGYWAATPERAAKMLKPLVAAGFMQGPGDSIKVSTGIYHQEFVPFDHIVTMARTYHAMFDRRLLVDIELAPGRTDTKDRILQKLGAAGLDGRTKLIFRNVSPLGRGRDLAEIATHPIETPCNSIHQMAFDPDGSVRPCCGMNAENQGLVIGRLGTHRLTDLVKRMQNDPILQFLAHNPMSSIFDHLDTPMNAGGYADICHLCEHALGGVTDKEPLQAQLFTGQQFYPFWFTLAGQSGSNAFLSFEPSDELD